MCRSEDVPMISRMMKLFGTVYGALVGVLVVALLITVALTFRSYGFTVDEDHGYSRAVAILNFLTSFGAMTDGIAQVDAINVYGAMPDVIALVLQKLFPSLGLDSRHLVSALFGVLGVYYVYRLGADFVAKPTGFVAALFLACNPMWFGHMFINPKDIPFAAILLMSSYYCLKAISGRHYSRWIWLSVAVSVGLFATTKLTGLLILGFVVVVMLLALALLRSADQVRIDRTLPVRILATGVAASLGCLLCFVFFWPQFYFFKFTEIIDVIRLFTNYTVWTGQVQIHGEYFNFDKIPRYYMPAYFAISMPLFLLALLPVGTAWAIIRREPVIIAAAVICTAFFVYQAVTGARVAGGYRHFIFLLPFTSLIAAYPIARLVDRNVPPLARAAGAVLAVGGVVISLVSMYRLFPYQYSSYNLIVGGLPGADGRYYIDIWRSALREALLCLETIATPGRTVRVYACGSTLNFAEHPRFERVTDPALADYAVSVRRNCPSEMFQGLEVAGEIRREEVVFAVIYARKERQP